MDKALKILEDELAIYAKDPINGTSFLTTYEDKAQKVYAVVAITQQQGQHHTGLGLLVRLRGDCIIIERDMSNKMLVDALVQRGVPRDRIVLAYAGEKVEEAA